MTDASPKSVQTAHVLLDLLASYDEHEISEVNHRAAGTAFERLNEIGAVKASRTDDDVLSIDISELLGGFGFVGGLLVNALASKYGIDRLDVIASLRNQLEA